MRSFIMLTLVLSLNLLADDLFNTVLEYRRAATKVDVKRAKGLLTKALKLNEDSKQFKKMIKAAKKALESKVVSEVVNAAIVVQADTKDKMNLSGFEGFIDDAGLMCFNGSVIVAYNVLLELQDNLWVYDELSIDEIRTVNDHLLIRVFDNFSFSDVDAKDDEKEDFMTEYEVYPCK